MIEVYGFGNPINFNKNLSLKNKKTLNELESTLIEKLDNLSSFEPDSLTLLSYLHLQNIGFKWIEVSHPSSSPTGELPVLKSGLLFISGLDKIIQWLKTEGYDLDKHLTNNEKLYNLSYFKLFGDILKDSYQYYTYQDDDNFINWTRPLLGKLLTIPFNYITPGYLIDKSKNRLNTYYLIHGAEHTNNSTSQKVSLALKYYRNTKKTDSTLTVEFKILNKAQSIYNQIETKLGDKPFLFGEELTSTDLLVANYLICHANPILKNSTLFTQLSKNHSKLIDYAVRVNELIGKIQLNNYKESKSESNGTWYNLSSFKNYISNSLLPKNSPINYFKKLDWESLTYVGLGLGSMIGYAIYHGFIQFDIEDEENDLIEFEQQQDYDDQRVGHFKGLEGPPKLPIMRDDDSEDESEDDEDDENENENEA